MSLKTAVMRNIQSGDLYRHISGDTYKNLRTGAIGSVPPEKAKEIFRLSVAATKFCNSNNLIDVLIEKLGLRIYHND